MLYFGYDPGGNGCHGVAAFRNDGSGDSSIETALLPSADAVIDWFIGFSEEPAAIGVDTLTCWSTGPSGWRPADRWLREHEQYRQVGASVASSNSLYGAMSINGMAVLLALRVSYPDMIVTETHPKILAWHFRRVKYDFVSEKVPMITSLSEKLGCELGSKCSEHEWDAAISALAAMRCATGQWKKDLHRLDTLQGERLISPCGPTKYAWPD